MVFFSNFQGIGLLQEAFYFSGDIKGELRCVSMEIIWKIKTYSSIAASLAGYREKL